MAERCASYRDMTENTTDKNKNTHIVCKVFSLLSLNEATRYVRADFNNHLPKGKKKRQKSEGQVGTNSAHVAECHKACSFKQSQPWARFVGGRLPGLHRG